MKTQDLLNGLNEDELEELKNQTNIKNSPILGKLINELAHSLDKEVSKEDLFQKVYLEDYNAKKDARLRNRLKALNQIIRDFMVQKELNKSVQENIHVYNANLINAYKQRGLASVMDLEFNKIAKYAEDELQLKPLHRMLFAKISLDIAIKPKTLENIEQIELITQKYFDTVVLYTIRLFRDAEKIHTNTQINKALNSEKGVGINWENAVKHVNPLAKTIDLIELIGKDPYADTSYYSSKTFQEPKVVDRLKYLKIALNCLDEHDYPGLSYSSTKLDLLDGIIYHHIQCGEWQFALDYLNKQKLMFSDEQFSVIYIMQSMHCLIATGQYKLAIKLVNDSLNKTSISQSSVAANIYLLEAFSNAWLGELGTARTIVSQQDQTLDYVKLIGRLIEMICYFKENDLSFAERESINALKALRGRPKSKFYMRMSSTFKLMGKIINAMQQPKPERNVALLKVRKKFNITQYEAEHYLRESVPYNSILLELDKLIEIHT